MEDCDKGLTKQIHEIKWTGPIHCRGDKVERMCRVLAIPWSWYVCLQCMFWTFLVCQCLCQSYFLNYAWYDGNFKDFNLPWIRETPSVDSHDNNQCKYRNDDYKNFLPILFYPFVSGICFLCLVLQFIQVITCGGKNTWTLQQSDQYRKNEATDGNNKRTITVTTTTTTTEQKRLKYRC